MQDFAMAGNLRPPLPILSSLLYLLVESLGPSHNLVRVQCKHFNPYVSAVALGGGG